MVKIVIGIPAYNEEKNIANLLNDVLEQKIEVLEKKIEDCVHITVYVISDLSTDKTDEIVNLFADKHGNVRLIRKNKRTGKSASIKLLFELARGYDGLILFDADVRLDINCVNVLLERIILNKTILVAGSAIPKNDNIFNIAMQANFFGWAFVNKIKNNQRRSIYHLCGCVYAISEKLYNNPDINNITGIGDDTFIYLLCVQKNMKFEYLPSAIVHVKSPTIMNDYLNQSVRRSSGVKENEKIFGRSLVERESKINNLFLIMLKSLFQYPFQGLCWFVLYSYGQIFISDKIKIMPNWEISSTTK
jgi:cellulose synthase/poly-beta-1,6-N-acetylglucosamine synthase-like glycosyltransferase